MMNKRTDDGQGFGQARSSSRESSRALKKLDLAKTEVTKKSLKSLVRYSNRSRREEDHRDAPGRKAEEHAQSGSKRGSHRFLPWMMTLSGNGHDVSLVGKVRKIEEEKGWRDKANDALPQRGIRRG
mmetsp:Transcript_35814/g.85373  ORF Transcript_35814/g.85373 Transcript_35814/m.85373 type:complete len:126 (+) Transcript_35814:248-625(+)